MQRKPDYTMGSIGNLYFIHQIHPSDFPHASNILTTNETGAFLWNHLDKETSLDALTEQLAAYYEIEPEPVKEDVAAFLKQLRQIHAISY